MYVEGRVYRREGYTKLCHKKCKNDILPGNRAFQYFC